MRRPKICILLLNWNGEKDTIECLASLEKLEKSPFTVRKLVIDNGSKPGSAAAIRAAFPDVPIDETGENLGFAGGNNRGIAWALDKGADWIWLLNNDTIVDPECLLRFYEAAEQKPEVALWGSKIYRYKDPKRIDHLGGFWDPQKGEFTSLAAGALDDGTCYESIEEVDYACGASLFIHRSVFETIGFLEPKFFLFWEETDFCFRAKRAGFPTWIAPKVKVWHKVSSSFVGGKPHMHYFWWRSRLLWVERNLPYEERKALYRKTLYPEIAKTVRHYLLRSLQHLALRFAFRPISLEQRQKKERDRAGLLGILHYARNRFGNCPKSFLPASGEKGKHV